MKLLLVRHGNTFAAGETPVRVGANEDLPLTPEGEAQAAALADVLKDAGITPDLCVTGPLQRTRRHIEIIMRDLGVAGTAEVDSRLMEIDYGAWGGLSDAEIVDRFGPVAARELAAWETESRWPSETVTWAPGADAVRTATAALAGELAGRLAEDGIALVCSSNGILRYFLDLVPGGLPKAQSEGRAKMSTGAASVLRLDAGGIAAEVVAWNVKAGQPIAF